MTATARPAAGPAIVVVGGGPAGCIAAKRLCEAGSEVTLVARRRSRVACEGLSERTLGALEALACRNALAAVGAAVARVAAWNAEVTARNREHLVERASFDAALAADAAAAGVTVVRGRVTAIRRHAAGWVVAHRAEDGGLAEGRAAFLIEARGREAPLARGVRLSGPSTVALVQRRIDLVRRPRSAVASCPVGWAWFIAPGDGTAVLHLVVSAAAGAVPKRRELDAFFDAHLRELADAAAWLEGTRPAAAVTARDATPRLARPVLGRRRLRVGDAAVSVDPLSGHGVFEAIGGALAAVPVIRTLLERPGDAAVAGHFYRERTEETFRRYARSGREVYAAEERWPDAPFWSERRLWPDDGAPATPAAPGAPAVARRPVVEDGFVVEREVVVTPGHPRGIARVADVPVVPLLRVLAGCRGESWQTAQDRAGAALDRRADQIDAAMRWLSLQGLLAWAGPDVDPPPALTAPDPHAPLDPAGRVSYRMGDG